MTIQYSQTSEETEKTEYKEANQDLRRMNIVDRLIRQGAPT